jgi:Protein of unknown function (DUF3605)
MIGPMACCPPFILLLCCYTHSLFFRLGAVRCLLLFLFDEGNWWSRWIQNQLYIFCSPIIHVSIIFTATDDGVGMAILVVGRAAIPVALRGIILLSVNTGSSSSLLSNPIPLAVLARNVQGRNHRPALHGLHPTTIVGLRNRTGMAATSSSSFSSSTPPQHDNEQQEGNESDDSAKRIRLPNLKYGYRSVPFAWDELVEILGSDDDYKPQLERLCRSVEQQKDYQIYRRDLLLTWRSLLDSMLCKTFDTVFTPCRPAAAPPSPPPPLDGGQMMPQHTTGGTPGGGHPVSGGKLIAVPALADVKTVHKRLVLNDFPYYMTDDIDHYVLWKIGGVACNKDDIQEAQNQLRQQGYEERILHWTNPPHLKSIPEIDHVHILARRQKSNQPPEPCK